MALLDRSQLQELPENPPDTLQFIPDGAAGIRATVDAMVRLTKQFRTNSIMRTLGEQIVAHVAGKNYYGEAQAIQEWVRNNVRYTRDVLDVETVKTPLNTYMTHMGDCDDMSLLAGTLLNTLGHPVRYVAVGTQNMGEYEHVYVETKIGFRWVGLETTEDVPLGWTPQPQLSRMVGNV